MYTHVNKWIKNKINDKVKIERKLQELFLWDSFYDSLNMDAEIYEIKCMLQVWVPDVRKIKFWKINNTWQGVCRKWT
jgi:hypothetical protein